MDALKIPKANVVRISGLFNKSNIESKKKKKKRQPWTQISLLFYKL